MNERNAQFRHSLHSNMAHPQAFLPSLSPTHPKLTPIPSLCSRAKSPIDLHSPSSSLEKGLHRSNGSEVRDNVPCHFPIPEGKLRDHETSSMVPEGRSERRRNLDFRNCCHLGFVYGIFPLSELASEAEGGGE